MKLVVLLGDGMADLPLAALQGKTPLQAAIKPNMDLLARRGKSGLAQTVPEGFPPGSDVANLCVMGYAPSKHHSGRAPLEAAAMGVLLGEADIAFRCNFVTIVDGIMLDYSAGHITSEEGRELIEALQPLMPERRLYAGVSYRNLLVLQAGAKALCTPSHDISDQSVAEHLPRGPPGGREAAMRDGPGRGRGPQAPGLAGGPECVGDEEGQAEPEGLQDLHLTEMASWRGGGKTRRPPGAPGRWMPRKPARRPGIGKAEALGIKLKNRPRERFKKKVKAAPCSQAAS